LFLFTSISLIVFLLSLAITAGLLALPIPTALAITCLSMMVTLRILLHWARARLRFCVIFHQDSIQFGRGLSRCFFPYQDVDIIYLISPIIKVRCGNRTASVCLLHNDVPNCLLLLQRFCPNAVLVDHTMQAHLPDNPPLPQKIVDVVERHYFRIALIRSVGVGYFILLFLLLTWGLMQWHNGNLLLKIVLEDVLAKFFVGFCVITLLGIAWQSWRTVHRIRQKRIELSMSSDKSLPSNDSTSTGQF
jgi:hypothetical protein